MSGLSAVDDARSKPHKIREEITKFVYTLLEEEETRRLKRFKTTDLTTRIS